MAGERDMPARQWTRAVPFDSIRTRSIREMRVLQEEKKRWRPQIISIWIHGPRERETREMRSTAEMSPQTAWTKAEEAIQKPREIKKVPYFFSRLFVNAWDLSHFLFCLRTFVSSPCLFCLLSFYLYAWFSLLWDTFLTQQVPKRKVRAVFLTQEVKGSRKVWQ